MKKNSFIEEIRELQVSENQLKKRLGTYNCKEVDEYIAKLIDQIKNAEKVFQERYEEVRTSLLAMAREKEELTIKMQEMKNNKKLPENWETLIDQQGQVAIFQNEYERLKSQSFEYQMTKEMNYQLVREKQCIEVEMIKQQDSYRAEKDAIISRYQETKKNQQESLRKLQESFMSSISNMGDLAKLITSNTSTETDTNIDTIEERKSII